MKVERDGRKLRLNYHVTFYDKNGRVLHRYFKRKKSQIYALDIPIPAKQWHLRVNYGNDMDNEATGKTMDELKDWLTKFTEKQLLDFVVEGRTA